MSYGCNQPARSSSAALRAHIVHVDALRPPSRSAGAASGSAPGPAVGDITGCRPGPRRGRDLGDPAPGQCRRQAGGQPSPVSKRQGTARPAGVIFVGVSADPEDSRLCRLSPVAYQTRVTSNQFRRGSVPAVGALDDGSLEDRRNIMTHRDDCTISRKSSISGWIEGVSNLPHNAAALTTGAAHA